ncbi:Tuberculostearic acid methyltransferase UfaA1 [Bienertia sinuspersici]
MQNIPETGLPLLLTLNPPQPPENILLKSSTRVLVPSIAAMKASRELSNIQGQRGIWFCGAYHGYGFPEGGLKAGLAAANAVLRRSFTPLASPKQMVFSSTEAAARSYITNFLKRFISIGCLILLEDGGAVLKFEGSDRRFTWKTAIRVHTPQFYWKVTIEADFGLADAFINGDISVVDNNEGLLNLFRIFLANLYLCPSAATTEKKSFDFKGWWTPMFFTAGIASAKYFYRHVSQKNSVKLALNNVARHYDLSNEMFSLFLDETMTYSCAIFKSENEDLKTAQLRKLHLLIDKARVEEQHKVLDIGCGWGSMAIEIVKKTGCHYTGITLAEEQLKYAEEKVKEAGLQVPPIFLMGIIYFLRSILITTYPRIKVI